MDWMRNGFNRNQIAAWSTRARPGATVSSTPLHWRELRATLDPARFDVRSVMRRVRGRRDDPWSGWEAARRPITPEVVAALGAPRRR